MSFVEGDNILGKEHLERSNFGLLVALTIELRVQLKHSEPSACSRLITTAQTIKSTWFLAPERRESIPYEPFLLTTRAKAL
jgi:hypothetical protein